MILLIYIQNAYLNYELQHNEHISISKSKRLKCVIRSNIQTYLTRHAHEFNVTSTFPYRAIDKFQSNKKSNRVLEFMDVLWLIDSIHGGDSSKGGLLIVETTAIKSLLYWVR